ITMLQSAATKPNANRSPRRSAAWPVPSAPDATPLQATPARERHGAGARLRTKLMAATIKRFLTQFKRHAPEQYDLLPEEFRRRYEPSESQLFAGAKDTEARLRSRQQAAEDLLFVIEQFADCAELNGRSTYKILSTILEQQGLVVNGKVTVRPHSDANRIQN